MKKHPDPLVKILEFTSDEPLGEVLDLLRFAIAETKGIKAEASEAGHYATVQFCQELVESLRSEQEKAVQLPDPTDPRESGAVRLGDAVEGSIFHLAVARDWGWLSRNWRSVLPSGKSLSEKR